MLTRSIKSLAAGRGSLAQELAGGPAGHSRMNLLARAARWFFKEAACIGSVQNHRHNS